MTYIRYYIDQSNVKWSTDIVGFHQLHQRSSLFKTMCLIKQFLVLDSWNLFLTKQSKTEQKRFWNLFFSRFSYFQLPGWRLGLWEDYLQNELGSKPGLSCSPSTGSGMTKTFPTLVSFNQLACRVVYIDRVPYFH